VDLLERYRRLGEEFLVLARPESSATPEDWRRLRQQRDRLENALQRAQEAHRAAQPPIPMHYNLTAITVPWAALRGPQGPAGASDRIRGDSS
jgi:hypothetical protein